MSTEIGVELDISFISEDMKNKLIWLRISFHYGLIMHDE